MAAKMKKLLFIIILLTGAVCYLRQPEYCSIAIGQNTYEIYEKNNYLYAKKGYKKQKVIHEKIIDYKVYDIDGDQTEEILVITHIGDQLYGGDFIVFDTESVKDQIVTKEIYREDFSAIKPWKVSACNLDNDGEADIFIGVHKDTVFYKDERNRPFFYSWDGKSLKKKWLGSFFTDWELVDITFGDFFNLGYDAAAILEKRNDEYRVGIYKFIGFGFENMYTSKIYRDLNSIRKEYRNINY